MRTFTVAIAGGGASGTLVASALARRTTAANVVIIDPCEHLGRGVAYAANGTGLVLNAPAGKMSALPHEPDHFVRWLTANGDAACGPAAFVPRARYGDYLNGLARDAEASIPGRWRHVRATATAVRHDRDRVRVTCSTGEPIEADAVVIATGNASPAPWPNVSPEARESGRFFDSAWERGAIVPASPGETVLLLGTGLTAADAVCGLRRNGHRGSIVMVSRRGLVPQEHRVFDAPPATVPEARTVAELLDAVRTLVDGMQGSGGDWRRVIDDVRPRTNALWRSLSLEEQRRFVRHALPYWNVHRHRIAPEPAREIAELRRTGTLRVVSGRTREIEACGAIVRVPIDVRGSGDVLTVDAGRVINCSGPQHDFRLLPNPLIRNLLAQGAMVPNPLGIGIRIDDDGALTGADGVPSSRLYAIGPARFGTLIETTAIPEIREQARELAEHLCEAFAPTGERLAV